MNRPTCKLGEGLCILRAQLETPQSSGFAKAKEKNQKCSGSCLPEGWEHVLVFYMRKLRLGCSGHASHQEVEEILGRGPHFPIDDSSQAVKESLRALLGHQEDSLHTTKCSHWVLVSQEEKQ